MNFMCRWMNVNCRPMNDPVDLVPFFRFDYNMQQSGTASTQYVVVFCYLLILNQQSHEFLALLSQYRMSL